MPSSKATSICIPPTTSAQACLRTKRGARRLLRSAEWRRRRRTIVNAGESSMLEEALQDARFGIRTLRKNPGLTLIAVLSLALATGATTAIFSVVYSVALRPLPFAEPNRLVQIAETAMLRDDLESLRTAEPRLRVVCRILNRHPASSYALRRRAGHRCRLRSRSVRSAGRAADSRGARSASTIRLSPLSASHYGARVSRAIRT